MNSAEVYQVVTDRMIAALESGTVPWSKPWSAGSGVPRSMSSGDAYRGINVWLLALTAEDQGYTSQWWGTFKRIKDLGGHLRKGSKGTKVVYWKAVVTPNPDNPDEPHTYMHPYVSTVFSADQCDNLPEVYYPVEGSEPDILPDPESVLNGYIARGPNLRYGGGRAYYTPDEITLPRRCDFHSAEEFYSTAFHECGHSTGNASRLNRKGIAEFDHFGSEKYGKEELVAEMTAVMLCALTGVESAFDNSANYIASWLQAIKGDVKLVPTAASAAQAATDLIMGTVGQDTDQDSSQRVLVTV